MTQADRALDDGIGFITNRLGLVGKRMAALEIRRGTKICFNQGECDIVTLFYQAKYFHCLVHDFRANPVSRQQGDFVVLHTVVLWVSLYRMQLIQLPNHESGLFYFRSVEVSSV